MYSLFSSVSFGVEASFFTGLFTEVYEIKWMYSVTTDSLFAGCRPKRRQELSALCLVCTLQLLLMGQKAETLPGNLDVLFCNRHLPRRLSQKKSECL